MQNIEPKSRLGDYTAAKKVATTIASKQLGTQHQIDTYFHCLMCHFSIAPADLLADSYGEMVG